MAIIRAAVEADIPQIHAIYAHYVLHSVLTFRENVPPLTETRDKLAGIKSRKLPFLVAVDQKDESSDVSDKVLGYACASPFRGHMLSYASTVELSLFLDPEYRARGLGTMLISAIIEELKHTRHLVGECIGDPEHQVLAEGGAGTRVRHLLAVMALDTKGKDAGEGLRNWYVKRGFVERGRMSQIGFKDGRWYVCLSCWFLF